MRTHFTWSLGSILTSLVSSADLKETTALDLLESGGGLTDLFVKIGELSGRHDCRGELNAGLLAHVCHTEGGADNNDTLRPRHLQLEVGIVRNGHELRVTWPA